jgi:hypothetical protein
LLAPFSLASGRLGDDVIMTNVLSFDVQVYDPGAPVVVDGGNNTVLEPRDRGYSSGGSVAGYGAYVDLGYTPSGALSAINPPLFRAVTMTPRSVGGGPFPNYTFYDTWSWHYENDGINQYDSPSLVSPPVTDEGTNGLDDDGANGVDDIGERETMPPYPSPLRGIRVTIRVYEPSSQQVRQVTVVQDYLPD